jgi:hypothetical protein
VGTPACKFGHNMKKVINTKNKMYCINKCYGDQDQAQQAGVKREEVDGQKHTNELDDNNNRVAVMFEDDKNG